MFDFTLLTDINTFDNKILLKAGSKLTAEVLDDLISSNNDKPYNMYSLLHYESIYQDLIFYIGQYPYKCIFSIGDKFPDLLQCMEKVYLADPVLRSLVSLKTYDEYTYKHTLIVFALSTLFATYLLESFQDRIKEATSSPSHDIGKICTPVSILQKTSPLTKRELDVLAQHSIAGYVLLSYYYRETDNLSSIVARDHHEKKNGIGGLRGIHLDNPMVEIVVVCDIYDALISIRPYRPISYDNRTALELLTAMAERNEVNLDVVKTLIALNRKNKPDYGEYILSTERRGTHPENNNYGIIIENGDKPERSG